MPDKVALRLTVKRQRSQLDPVLRKNWQRQMFCHLQAWPVYQQADVLFSYVSSPDEVDTIGMIQQAISQGKQVAVPRSNPQNHTMQFYLITHINQLSPGYMGILEPDEHQPAAQPTQSTLCLVPGLCFSKKGHRLGYGKGYYDRFLSQYSGVSAGLVFPPFLMQNLPVSAFDFPVDYLLTPGGITSCICEKNEKRD